MSDIISKIFGKAGETITKTVSETIDVLSTSDNEKLAAKNALTSTVMANLNAAMHEATSVILAEANGNWLQRSWRPILMLAFGFIIIYEYFISKVFSLPSANLPVDFWDLLELGMGGYVVGRSVEKVAETVTKNVDLSFIKKKDREVK